MLGFTDRVHEMFEDQQSRYHHYKWYVGPDPDSGVPGFVTVEQFRRRFQLTPAAHD